MPSVNHKPRIVVDTGILVSAMLSSNSKPDQALNFAFAKCQLFVSADTLAELDGVVARSKFDQFAPSDARLAFAAYYRAHCELVHVTSRVEDCADPKDNKFLELALDSKADLLIASDVHLTALNPWRGLVIINPSGFLELI
jgi:putative PIN family toxin of toxin-antitoxin system